MHDPMVVVCDVPMPLPRRSRWRDRLGPRWGLDVSRRTNDENRGERTYPWWRLKGYTLKLAGRAYELRTFATIWHIEPGGADSGDVCPHYVTEQYPGRDREFRSLRGWKWHVHHWWVQFPWLQGLRRTLFTRCGWCGGPSRKSDPVNVRDDRFRDGDRPWWRGESGLVHMSCSSAGAALRTCICVDPLTEHDSWGSCAVCGKFRPHGLTEANRAFIAVMGRCQPGTRPAAGLLSEARRASDAVGEQVSR